MDAHRPEHVIRADDDSRITVESGHPRAEFVQLTDEHGGIHLIPMHLYVDIQEETRQLKLAVEKRREYLRAVRENTLSLPDRGAPPNCDEGDLSELVDEVRAFGRSRRQVSRLFR